eukprot:EG_transcript_5361
MGRKKPRRAAPASAAEAVGPDPHTTDATAHRASAAPSGNAPGRVARPSRRPFLLGLLLGVLLGALLVCLRLPPPPPPDVLLNEVLRTLDPDGQLQTNAFASLTNLREFVPAMPSFKANYSLFAEAIKPGKTLADMGHRARHPVVMIPGFVSTGLELWSGEECAMKYFRQRMWGTFAMVHSMLLAPECWMQHMALDLATGMDPEGRKLRPAQGFEAADYFLPGYWIWGKLIENLALLGYDNNNMVLLSYDWRLSLQALEERDLYFTRLQHTIELLVRRWKHKAVVLGHSMGVSVFLYFLKWVESPLGGDGGRDWVARHIESFGNLAGPVLGVPKAVAALLSGEMRDTTNLGPLEPYLTRDVFGPYQRRQLFRTWYSLSLLLPKGGDTLWGTPTAAADDDLPDALEQQGEEDDPDSAVLPPGACRFRSAGCVARFSAEGGRPNLTMAGAIDALHTDPPEPFRANLRRWFSFGVAADPSSPQYDQPKYWTNPLETALPNAPNLTIYCLYGTGLPTERAYHYTEAPPAGPVDLPYLIDKDVTADGRANGVLLGPGDGTVPLLSLGYMCTRGWRDTRFNPHGVQVRTREYAHQRGGFIPVPRGGDVSADHVDIMGNSEFITDVLSLAVGRGAELDSRIVSDIERIAAQVTLP